MNAFDIPRTTGKPRARNDSLELAKAADRAITGQQYCSSHNGYVPVGDGKLVPNRGGARFICNCCLAKKVPGRRV